MATSISTFLNVDPDLFASTGAFDAVLEVDSKLFIDPHLVKSLKIPEFQNSYDKITQRFSNIFKLLAASKRIGDVAWRNADRLFTFPEVEGLCIGYSTKSTSGSGMGKELRKQLLLTAKTICDAGITDPEIFELMWLFEDGVGPDRISDMVARIILEDLLSFSHRVFADLGINHIYDVKYSETLYRLPINPHNRLPIILIPRDVLRDLPVASSLADIEEVIGFNRLLRQRLNELIGVTWKQSQKLRKYDYKRVVLEEPEILKQLVEAYSRLPTVTYDFETDPSGQIIWYNASRRAAIDYPLDLSLNPNPSSAEIKNVVLKICGQFKQLVENNALHTLLYRDDECSQPKREEAAQKLFFGVADAYCRANNLDLSPETNSGRGAVDFKVSRGYRGRVLVETKLTTNPNLVHGFDVQIEEYQKAERTLTAIYLVVHVGGSEKKIHQLEEMIETKRASGKSIPDIVHIYANRKASASHYKRP